MQPVRDARTGWQCAESESVQALRRQTGEASRNRGRDAPPPGAGERADGRVLEVAKDDAAVKGEAGELCDHRRAAYLLPVPLLSQAAYEDSYDEGQ
jgi:hypothetical protein